MKKDKELSHYNFLEQQRINNPPVGLVKEENEEEQNTYEYDLHLDPSLQWAGKKERPNFTVDTRSIHIHEKLDPQSIIAKLHKDKEQHSLSLNFHEENKLPFAKALDFYKHEEDWSNRFIAGDSALIMNSLIQKESMAGKVQCVYMDPPYGIKYSSNFQPFHNNHSNDYTEKNISTEPETIKAFRDTWELGIHSYLSYLRDRLLLCRELLSETGSCFVQIGDENVHHVREIMDEIFGSKNYVSLIAYKSTSGVERSVGPIRIHNYLIWYAKDKTKVKFNRLYKKVEIEDVDTGIYNMVETVTGERRSITPEEKIDPKKVPEKSKLFRTLPLHSAGSGKNEKREFNGELFTPPMGRHWSHQLEHFEELKRKNCLIKRKDNIEYIKYIDDFPYQEYNANWNDTGPELNKSYVVQTSPRIVRNCVLMASNPGDLVFDPTCGSGTTAYVAEETGRRWITTDTSRIAITLAKQRLLTSVFDYYKLAEDKKGISGGLLYKTVERQKIGEFAKGLKPEKISIYDSPLKDSSRQRVTSPFTVEGLPSHQAPQVKPLHDQSHEDRVIDNTNENISMNEWVNELLKNGVRARSNIKIDFNELELASGMRYIHAQGETKGDKPQKVMISFGPEHSTLGFHQVESAWQEARRHKPDLLIFVAIQFDSEASKSISDISKQLAGMELLKVQMNNDYSVKDLKKDSKSNDNFWLLGEPDVTVKKITEGEDKGNVEVTVEGYDYYDSVINEIIDGGKDDIACWLLDENYDGRCLIPKQIFIVMARKKYGWDNISKNLKATIDETKLEKYTGNTSLPFEMPKNNRIAVKIIDKRGVESLKVIDLKEI